MTQSARYYGIDATKAVAAIMVVLIHASWYLYESDGRSFSTYYVYRGSLEVAVPLFLIFSGFLIAHKDARGTLLWSYKMLVLYLVGTAIYVLFDLLVIYSDHIFLGRGMRAPLEKLLNGWTIGSFVRGELAEVHLWYLAATTVAALMVAYLKWRDISPGVMFVVGFSMWMLTVSGVMDISAISSFGGFPKALAYIALGIVLRDRGDQGNWRHLAVAAFALAGYTVLRYLEAGSAIELLVLVAAGSIATYAVRDGARKGLLSRLGGAALSVYILHVMFLGAMVRAIRYLGLGFEEWRSELWFTLALTCLATALSILVHRPFESLVVRPAIRAGMRFVDRSLGAPGTSSPPTASAASPGS